MAVTAPGTAVPDYRPHFPADSRHGIAILGCGGIARTAHLPAYAAHGLEVVGVWSHSGKSARLAREQFPSIGQVYESAEDLLADPRVTVVDIATRVEHRQRWLEAAVDAGKHVLAQKPLSDDLDAAQALVARAEESGLRLAVNQNARWAPVWRLATLLLEDGAIGDVVGVTHLLDKPLPPIAGTHFDDIPHMLITDYLLHWVDITRCWLGGKQVTDVQARDGRVPGQPETARNPWSATIHVQCQDGGTALMRVVGDAQTRTPSCPFWIHGTKGTLRGSILGGEFVELERGGVSTRYTLDGAWFVDGFAGAMGELLCAIEEEREPYNSARHNLASLQITAHACASADEGGRVREVSIPL